jgi:hypothetical protein
MRRGALAGEAQVGTEGEAHAAAVGRPVDRGDHRLRHPAQRRHEPRVVAHRLLRDPTDLEAVDVRDDAVVLQVEARREGPARPGEDDDPGVVLVGDRRERVVQLADQLDRHGVEPVGPVHAHHRHVRSRLLHEHERRAVPHARAT